MPQQALLESEPQVRVHQAQIETRLFSLDDRFFIRSHALNVRGSFATAKDYFPPSKIPTNAFGTIAAARQFFAGRTFAAHRLTSSRVS